MPLNIRQWNRGSSRTGWKGKGRVALYVWELQECMVLSLGMDEEPAYGSGLESRSRWATAWWVCTADHLVGKKQMRPSSDNWKKPGDNWCVFLSRIAVLSNAQLFLQTLKQDGSGSCIQKLRQDLHYVTVFFRYREIGTKSNATTVAIVCKDMHQCSKTWNFKLFCFIQLAL